MPKPYPQEFRDDVVNVARNREPGQTIKQTSMKAPATMPTTVATSDVPRSGRGGPPLPV